MLEPDKIDVSKETDVNKTNVLHESIICHYWYFLEINFRFQPKVCDVYHDLMKNSINLNDVKLCFC